MKCFPALIQLYPNCILTLPQLYFHCTQPYCLLLFISENLRLIIKKKETNISLEKELDGLTAKFKYCTPAVTQMYPHYTLAVPSLYPHSSPTIPSVTVDFRGSATDHQDKERDKHLPIERTKRDDCQITDIVSSLYPNVPLLFIMLLSITEDLRLIIKTKEGTNISLEKDLTAKY